MDDALNYAMQNSNNLIPSVADVYRPDYRTVIAGRLNDALELAPNCEYAGGDIEVNGMPRSLCYGSLIGVFLLGIFRFGHDRMLEDTAGFIDYKDGDDDNSRYYIRRCWNHDGKDEFSSWFSDEDAIELAYCFERFGIDFDKAKDGGRYAAWVERGKVRGEGVATEDTSLSEAVTRAAWDWYRKALEVKA